MRNTLRVVLALGGASVVGAALVMACTSDTSVDGGGTEAGSDAPYDSPAVDSQVPQDAGADTAPPFDGGFLVDTFDDVLATEQCKTLARCCFGTPTPADGGADGGTFDQAACVASLKKAGFQGSNLGSDLKDAGNVTLDQTKAADCIAKVKGLSCNLPGPEYTAVRATCFAVYSGKLAAGHVCSGAVECQPGLYCSGMLDGGAGTCAAIKPVGGPCGANPDTALSEYEDTCSYRGGGGTGNYCEFFDLVGGVNLPAADWKCAAARDAGADCVASTWCKDTFCSEDTFTCTSPYKLYDTSCAAFVK